jgi:hypothetical protein
LRARGADFSEWNSGRERVGRNAATGLSSYDSIHLSYDPTFRAHADEILDIEQKLKAAFLGAVRAGRCLLCASDGLREHLIPAALITEASLVLVADDVIELGGCRYHGLHAILIDHVPDKYRKATDEEIDQTIKQIYDEAEYGGQNSPNLVQLPNKVKPRLQVRGLVASGQRIMKLGRQPKHAGRRRLFEVMDHLPEIEAWRQTLTPRERAGLNHPSTVLRRWKIAKRAAQTT